MGSLLLYISAFFYSGVLASYYQNNVKRSDSFNKICWAALIMLFPLFIGIFRYGIGIDYENYLMLFEKFHHTSWANFAEDTFSFEYINKAITDIGYFITGDVYGVFALYLVLTLILFELSLINFKDIISLPIATIVLLLLMYSMTYNIVRQSLAVSVVFYSFKYVKENKFLLYAIGCLVATAIHSSSIIALPLFLLKEDNGVLNSKVVRCIVLLLPLAISVLAEMFSSIFLFERYFDNYTQEETNVIVSYILKLPVLFPILLNYKYFARSSITKFICLLFFMELLLLYTASIYKWAFRLSYYSFFGQVLAVGILTKKQKINSSFYKIYFIIWYTVYFYVLFYLWGRDAIFPYTHL